MPSGEVETACQKARNASTRRFGGLPAMTAELMVRSRSRQPNRDVDRPRERLINTSLIGAKRAAALKQERDLLEGCASLRQEQGSCSRCAAPQQAYGACTPTRKPVPTESELGPRGLTSYAGLWTRLVRPVAIRKLS